MSRLTLGSQIATLKPRLTQRDDSLDENTAARYTSANPVLLRELRQRGEGPSFIVRNGEIRYLPHALNNWLRNSLANS